MAQEGVAALWKGFGPAMARVRIDGVWFRCEVDTQTSGFPRKCCHFRKPISAFSSDVTVNKNLLAWS